MRSSGILLPVFSLGGDFGIGTMGKGAFEFADFLCASGQRYWQILPLTPTSYGNSPYQSPSVFAGNPYFIDPQILYENALIDKSDLDSCRRQNKGTVDYADLYKSRLKVIKQAAKHISGSDKNYLEFCENQCFWLEKYSVFMALKEKNNMVHHLQWNYRSAEDIAVLKKEIAIHSKIQFLFYTQWLALKKYANAKGVHIMGDLPVYPAEDSSDYYFSPNMFLEGVVAACPPDSFNINGQLWGNPVYDWQKMKANDFLWWKERLRHSAEIYDSIRIDHFRGFYEYFSTPKGATAKEGRWSKGPGLDFCRMVRKTFPKLDIVAEDLGFLTDDTREFFRKSTFDTMKVLLFAFDEKDSEYLPHNHRKNSVVYTGTHDTPTVLQWICSQDSSTITRAMDYLGAPSIASLGEYFIRGAFSSVAKRAIIPFQDWLKVGCGGRINTPGTTGNNWMWRIDSSVLRNNLSEKILSYTKIYSRNQEE